jgi:hypothetical protein
VRSPLEILGGRFDHALLTTYSFNLRFFEEWVLRALWAAEVRNVVVFVDHHELGRALADRAPSAAGRSYHLVAAAGARAAFHPKVILLSGRDGARLCVSSANLTPDGQLRNAESAIAFDSNLAGHLRPILDAGELFRRLSEPAPPHTADAILAAVGSLPEDDGAPSGYRLVHNLDRPLIRSFPPAGATRAIAPFVDSDGTAAARLAENGPLSVIVDAQNVAAGEGFFAGPWTIDARSFEARLHGKAYETRTPDGLWLLLGSPNLSVPALLKTAAGGNLEVAVALRPEVPLELPASQAFENVEELRRAAAARLVAAARLERDGISTGRAFDAWEDEQRIVLSGIPDGARVERWTTERWLSIGTAWDGAVLVADPDVRPTRIRALLPDGGIVFAVVAQPARLRARMRSPTSGRQTAAAERLPLDVETVRILEEALSQLYVLSELAGEPPPVKGPAGARGATEDAQPSEGLLAWMPRSPEEEPRIPVLYLRRWQGEPNALLALVRRVLRLDERERPAREDDVAREQLDLEDLGRVISTEQVEVEAPAEQGDGPHVDPAELDRYRAAFRRLFDRGLTFLGSTPNAILAACAFEYLLRLVEDLRTHSVKLAGRTEPLMPADPLRRISLELLDSYLGRGEHDPTCMASARIHLAALVRQRTRFALLERERLEALCFTWASELVALPGDLIAPAPGALDLDVAGAISWLQDYAERSDWAAIETEAARQLDPGWLEHQPWPMIVGCAAIPNRMSSPAWPLLAFSAPAGFAARRPFGVLLHNSGDGALAIHVVFCEPGQGLIVEAWERQRDYVWLERRYRGVMRSTIERLQNPAALPEADKVLEHATLEGVGEPLQSLLPLLEAARAALG